MKILRILNNNSLIVSDNESVESIIIGRGIAFGKKSGEKIEIENCQIEKRFILDNDNKDESLRLVQLVKEIPLEIIILSNKVIEYGKKHLNIETEENIEIPLTDHINFAIERCRKGMIITSDLLWEIKRLYPKEYKVSLEITKMINDECNINLPDDEATFIALHFINSQLYRNMDSAINSTHLLHDILNIIKYFFKVEPDEESLSYFRLITHLKFFAARVLKGGMFDTKDYFLYDFMRIKYPDVFECALKIQQYVGNKYGYTISEEEMSYLMVHIERVLER